MYQISDEDSSDSEDGIRFKTHTTRKDSGRSNKSSLSSRKHHRSRRSRSRSPDRNSRYSDRSERDRNHSRRKSPDQGYRDHRRDRRSPSRERKRHKEALKSDEMSRVKPREVEKSSKIILKHKKPDINISGPKISESTVARAAEKCEVEDGGMCGPKIPERLKPKVEKCQNRDSMKSKFENVQDEDENVCGPKIPDRLKLTVEKSQTELQNDNLNDGNTCGPKLPECLKPKVVDILCGPVVPENLKPKLVDTQTNQIESEMCGPKLPDPELRKPIESNVCGPELLKSSESDNVDQDENMCGPKLPDNLLPKPISEENISCGPQLPPHLLNKRITVAPVEKVVGPTLPDHLRKQLEEQGPMQVDEMVVSDDDNGNVESDDDTFGPLPPELTMTSKNHIALEERALQMKLDKLAPASEDKTVREEWMIELPTVQAANLGLGPRQFRAKAGPDMSDRTSWTDTPQSKAAAATTKSEKVDLKKEAELMAIRQRDEEQEKMISKHKKQKKRDKSLLEQHQKKLMKKKKKDEEAGATVRRPFNRETDMKVNQFDDAQKKSILKKAQLLDTRFSSGQSKFL